MWVDGQRHALAALPLRRTQYPLYRRLGEPGRNDLDGGGKCCPPRIRSPERPARRESIYRLSYPGTTDFEGTFHNQLEATTETSMLYMYFLVHTNIHTHTHARERASCCNILFGSTLKPTQIPNPWSVGFWLHRNGTPSEKYYRKTRIICIWLAFSFRITWRLWPRI